MSFKLKTKHNKAILNDDTKDIQRAMSFKNWVFPKATWNASYKLRNRPFTQMSSHSSIPTSTTGNSKFAKTDSLTSCFCKIKCFTVTKIKFTI